MIFSQSLKFVSLSSVSQLWPILSLTFLELFLLANELSLVKCCYKFPADMKDPCHQKDCRFGAQCKPTIDGRNAECVCPTSCATYGDSRGSRPVCGTDGRDYPNVCEMRRYSCKEMKDITVKFTGACGE